MSTDVDARAGECKRLENPIAARPLINGSLCVRQERNGQPVLFVQVFQDPADLLASLSIQVPGRLVGEEISGLL
jgi:hypothetical protein